MKPVRIVSDGTSQNSHVYNADGSEIDSVRAVNWRLAAGETAVATVEVVMPQLDVSAHAEVVEVCPYCGHSVMQEDP